MARKTRKSKQTNGIDGDAAKGFIERIEALHADILSEQSAYMLKAKEIRADIKEVYAEAKEAGIPVKALKVFVKSRDFDRKKEKLEASLEEDDQTAFEQLVEALGDYGELPLGKATIDAQRRRDEREFEEAEPTGSAEEDEVLADVEAKGVRGAAADVIGDAEPSYSVKH